MDQFCPFCMSMAAFAASVFVLLFDDTDMLLLTSPFISARMYLATPISI